MIKQAIAKIGIEVPAAAVDANLYSGVLVMRDASGICVFRESLGSEDVQTLYAAGVPHFDFKPL